MRRVVALAIGLVLSTLLLGAGWLAATLRERTSRLAEARERLVRRAETVRAAVDESFEELRQREDQEPFYLYNHFYSPPDVLALSDPVAVSPLARPPRDVRLIGHFQLEPGGTVRTPYAPDDRSDVSPLARRVRAAVEQESFAPIRALAVGDAAVCWTRPVLDQESPGVPEGTMALHAVGGTEEGGGAETDGESSLALNLNPMMNSQVQDIQAAQAGDPLANERVLERGRQVPIISRRTVTWEEANAGNALAQRGNIDATQDGSPQAQSAGGRAQPSGPVVRAAMESARAGVEACTTRIPLSVRITVRGADGRPERIEVLDDLPAEEARCVRAALSELRLRPFSLESLVVRYAYRRGAPEQTVDEEGNLDNMVRLETEVDYTPMTFRDLGDSLVLYRLISHEGASVVQGVLLDRERIVREWIPSVIARRVGRESAPSVVAAGAGECAVRRPGSSVVRGIDLCFAPAVLARASAGVDDELGWQLGALGALWLMTFLAAAAIVMTARRAEGLSRQKSAFVSAVSHELRTPLTTLRMHAEMLEEGLVTEARRPKVHGELVRESVRLARLVDNVLGLSRLEEGKRHIRTSEADLRQLVRDAVEGQRRFVQERGFALEGPKENGALEARVDPQAVEQIVVNLLDNAVKYGAGEEKSIEVWVGTIDGAPALAVRDRGPGIPSRERRKVFERFHRVEREEHAHAPGTGIGLALVAELAQAHGGEASVHPRDGGGVEVRVLLAPRS